MIVRDDLTDNANVDSSIGANDYIDGFVYDVVGNRTKYQRDVDPSFGLATPDFDESTTYNYDNADRVIDELFG